MKLSINLTVRLSILFLHSASLLNTKNWRRRKINRAVLVSAFNILSFFRSMPRPQAVSRSFVKQFSENLLVALRKNISALILVSFYKQRVGICSLLDYFTPCTFLSPSLHVHSNCFVKIMVERQKL